jgi:hypothetical protein
MQGDYSLKVTPTYRQIYAGESANYEITVAGFDGFHEDVFLSIEQLPQDIQYSFSKTTIIEGQKAILHLETTQDIKPSEIQFDILGKANKTTKRISVTLEIQVADGDFSLNLEPNFILYATAGTSVEMKFKPSFSLKWDAPVTLTVGNLPQGVTHTIEPAIIEKKDFGKSVTVIFQINPSLPSQEYIVSIQGIGGGKTRTSQFRLSILSIQEGYASLHFHPIYPQIKIKKPTPVNIEIKDAKNLSYVEFQVLYDPILVDCLDVEPSLLLQQMPEENYSIIKEIDQTNGIVVIKVMMNTNVLLQGSGSFITLSLIGINKGTSQLAIQKASAKTNELKEYPIIGSEVDILVTEYLAGDVNGDGIVDVHDLALFAQAFGTSKKDTNYDPRCDFNDDGKVDGVDLIILSYNFGERL